MTEVIPQATHSGVLRIGEAEIGCAVLDDEKHTRVLTQQTILRAIGRTHPRGGEVREAAIGGLPFFLANPNLNPFISDDLRRSAKPLFFRPPKSGGRQNAGGGKGGKGFALGYPAQILPAICDVFLKAREADALTIPQMRIAHHCERLLRALAGLAMDALVDEATGYQYDRDRSDLQRILAAYINPELLPWTQRFEQEFFRQLFRLRGWQFSPPQPKKPQFVGKLINHLIYKQLPPGVLDKLREKNPPNEKGWRKFKHHQLLTKEIGNPHLEKQLVAVTTLMRASSNWRNFERSFNRVFPPIQGELDLIESTEAEENGIGHAR
jgi:hypothetical protein